MLYLLSFVFPEILIRMILGSIYVGESIANFIFSLQPYADQTAVLVPQFLLDLDLSAAERFIACFLLGYPAGLILCILPFGNLRHIFTILVGIIMEQWTIGGQWVHTLVHAWVVYLMLLFIPRRYIKWVVPIYIYTQCSIYHIYGVYKGLRGGTIMCVPFQMSMTQKMTAFAYNVYDGYILQQMEQVNTSNDANNNNKSKTRIREEKMALKLEKLALREIPTFLEYWGYVFCFTNFITGPPFEFAIYKNAILGNNLRKANKIVRPNLVWPTLKPLLQGCALLWLHKHVSYYYKYRELADYSVTRLSFFWRFVHLNMSCIPVRTTFYAPWKLAEGSNNIWYAGFDGYDDETGESLGWTNAQNVDIYQLEVVSMLTLNVDFSNLSKTWNMKTSNYLKRYMYYRSNGSLAYTYFMSALWHGFYPGFYVVGASVTMFAYAERLARKRVDRYIEKIPQCTWKRHLADMLLFIPYYYILQYFIQQGWSLEWKKMMIFWKSYYYYGHISMLLFFLIILIIPAEEKSSKSSSSSSSFVPSSLSPSRFAKYMFARG